MCSSNDVELVLDRQPFEYPALVRETLMSVNRDELSERCASMMNSYCWLVSKNSLFVWKKQSNSVKNESHRASQYPLPPSGLLYSANFACVYSTSTTTAGVIAVSGEGVIRHWPSTISSQYQDNIIDLNSEVILSLTLMNPQTTVIGGPVFLLCTTSGSVYKLRCDSKGSLECLKIGSREEKPFHRRLSSMIFGSQPNSHNNARAIKSLLVWRDPEEINDDVEEETDDPMMILIYPQSISYFDVKNRMIIWTANASSMVEHIVKATFERTIRDVNGVCVWFLDVSEFRGGELILIAAKHDASNHLSFFLALFPRFNLQSPSQPVWFCNLPLLNSNQYFDLDEENSFVGRVSLCIPRNTAESNCSERTDGILILHSNFVQSVFLPNLLDARRNHELPLNKVSLLPQSDKMIGFANDDRYCYVMLIDGGICSLRLLPKGFEDGTIDDDSFMHILPDGQASSDSAYCIQQAFILFANKNIVEASVMMQSLLSKSDSELTALVYSTFCQVLDNSAEEMLTETQLRSKKAFCNRMLLFLKHMGILDRICSAKILTSHGNTRKGASLLSEMSERVATAIQLRNWYLSSGVHAEAIEIAAEKMARLSGGRADPDYIIFGKLMFLHILPSTVVERTNAMLNRKNLQMPDRVQLLHVAADLLLTIADAVDHSRRYSSGIIVGEKDIRWTTGKVSDAYADLSKIVLGEMEAEDITHNESLRLKDVVVKLALFNLSESEEQPDGNDIILALYQMNHCKAAIGLAERFRDFKVLVKICLSLDGDERRSRLDSYKQRFAAQDFDLYLCKYLKEHNFNELLLEERGDRVDHYLASCDVIKWRRELQNQQYNQSSHSLLSVADREQSDVWRQKSLLALSKLAALCADEVDESTVAEIDLKLLVAKHQQDIPLHVIQKVFSDNPDRPLSVDEMVELNLLDDGDGMDDVTPLMRALSLLGDILDGTEDDSITSQLNHIWINVIKRNNWDKVTKNNISKTYFVLLLEAIVAASDDWTWKKKESVLPSMESVLRDCTKETKKNEEIEKLLRKGREKALMDIKEEISYN